MAKPDGTAESVSYTGLNGGMPTSGTFTEVSPDTWVESSSSGATFTFQEISESPAHVILYDSSRDVTIKMNLVTDNLTVQFGEGDRLVWHITDVSHSGWAV
jgi:hypothetical protein